ncbi:hypothetical protein EBB07_29260 [Paenibacillaceae bacterium]|nr:hypothetical protein EBB07_29260 [Paenibacillaceae bacterium]
MTKRIELDNVISWFEGACVKPIRDIDFDYKTDHVNLLIALALHNKWIKLNELYDCYYITMASLDPKATEFGGLSESYLTGLKIGYNSYRGHIPLPEYSETEQQEFLIGKEDGAKAWDILSEHFGIHARDYLKEPKRYLG